MEQSPGTLLLRIRAETLRLNLDRAHSNLNDLPSISEHLEKIHRHLTAVSKEADALGETLAKLRATVPRKDVRDAAKAQDERDRVTDHLQSAFDEIATLNSTSFLVKMGPVGKSIWQRLDDCAGARAQIEL